MTTAPSLVLVLTTVDSQDEAATIARALVDERLAACVNVLPPMVSVYRWKGSVESATEQQLIIKTTVNHVEAVKVRLAALHSYEVPEILVVPIADASASYAQWIAEST
jgi:periplasmic divalent cation tolerance protein